mmetsp:Transcript_8256/g.21279  ORF Transcript_8256/g.21279 Transcript_8256/m.21279 type:complete len:266 (+) Transcript_8256:970-1767(+)
MNVASFASAASRSCDASLPRSRSAIQRARHSNVPARRSLLGIVRSSCRTVLVLDTWRARLVARLQSRLHLHVSLGNFLRLASLQAPRHGDVRGISVGASLDLDERGWRCGRRWRGGRGESGERGIVSLRGARHVDKYAERLTQRRGWRCGVGCCTAGGGCVGEALPLRRRRRWRWHAIGRHGVAVFALVAAEMAHLLLAVRGMRGVWRRSLAAELARSQEPRSARVAQCGLARRPLPPLRRVDGTAVSARPTKVRGCSRRERLHG